MRKYILTLIIALTAMAAHAQTDTLLTLQGGQGSLAVRVLLPAGAPKHCPVAVICHGFTGNRNEPRLTAIADELLKLGIGAVLPDFNGHGESGGEFQNMTIANEIDDLDTIAAWVQTHLAPRAMAFVGHSQGGVVAVMEAAKLGASKVKALVLMAPAAVLRDDALRGNILGARFNPYDIPEYVQFGKRRLGRAYIEVAQNMPIYETAATYKGATLVLHGTHDPVVPYTYGQTFAREMPNATYRGLEGDDHGFSKSPAATSQAVAQFIKKVLKK